MSRSSSKKKRPRAVAAASLKLPTEHFRYSPTCIANLAAVIAREGILAPILVDHDRTIRAGIGLWLAVRHLGWPVVPVVWLNHSNARRLSQTGGAK